MMLARVSHECRIVSPALVGFRTSETNEKPTFEKVVEAAISAANRRQLAPIKERETHVTSSSGPTRRLAPFAFASRMLRRILSRFPSKSSCALDVLSDSCEGADMTYRPLVERTCRHSGIDISLDAGAASGDARDEVTHGELSVL